MNNYTEYPKLQKIQNQLEKIESRIQVLEAEQSELNNALRTATNELETAESLLVLERTDEATVKSLAAIVAKLSKPDTRELDRLRAAASILKNELPALKNEAVLAFCAEKRPAYVAALRALDKSIADTQSRYTEVSRLYDQAAAISPTSSMIVQGGAIKNPDIPTACQLEPVSIELFKKPEPNVWSDDLRTHAEKIRAAIAEIIAK